MTDQEMLLLQKLARSHGIQTSYTDATGHKQKARPETLLAALAALDVPAKDQKEIQCALVKVEFANWSRIVEPVMVAWHGRPNGIELRVPANTRRCLVRLKMDGGDVREISVDPAALLKRKREEFDGLRYISGRIPLKNIPPGYHDVEIEAGQHVAKSLIISAPRTSYTDPDLQRAWGLFLPMYAAHSKQSWGAGNLGDWKQLSAWTGSMGGKIVGSLPILAGFMDKFRCEPSPYSPASRLFWNEFFIDVTTIPEFATCRAAQKLVNSVSFQSQIKKFQKSSCVNYFWEMALRRKVLELLAEFFFSKPSARRNVFDRYLSAHPRLRDYASFRATTESRKTSWHNWLVRLREGPLRAGDYSETAARYHQYVQWIAQEQMNDVLDTCRKSDVKFYLDLPLGVNPDGYDVWREKQNFVSGVNAGAPPDIFFTRGQDWGFAPLHPQTIRENHYRHVLDVLRFQMKHTGLLRLDHVMSLYRLYWIPQQFPASEGVYVHYPLEELCALLNLESHRNRTVLVGENLGTVPPEVNAAMQQNHLRQMYVVQTELRPDPKRALSQPGQRMVASLNTHDMPPFAAFLDGSDIDHQVTLGLINDAKSNHQQRRKAVAALEKFLRRKHLLKAKKATAWELLRGCLHFLARSKAEVVLVNLEDLWREHVPQNIPGTGSEQPNWRHKACLKLESIINSPKIKELLAEVDSQRRER